MTLFRIHTEEFHYGVQIGPCAKARQRTRCEELPRRHTARRRTVTILTCYRVCVLCNAAFTSSKASFVTELIQNALFCPILTPHDMSIK